MKNVKLKILRFPDGPSSSTLFFNF
jgi:hypothetical protein